MTKNNSGFTLLEIIVTVGIIAILSTVALISFRSTRVAARDTKRLSDFNTLAAALQTYYQQTGSYPTILANGTALKSPDGQTTYLSAIPNNPSPQTDNGCPNNNYTYTVTANNKWFEVVSCLGQGESGSEIITLTPDGLTKKPNANYTLWNFNEGTGSTAGDTGNLGLSLSFIGSPIWESAGQCKEGTCLTLDGISDAASVTLPSMPKFTIMTWVKRLSNQTIDWEINNSYVHETQIFDSYFDKVGLTIFYYSEVDQTLTKYLAFDGNSETVITSSNPSRLNTYDHVAVTSDGTTKKLYVNGVLAASGVATRGIDPGVAKIGEGFAGLRNLNATLDDFRIYDRALSATEINLIYGSVQ